MQIIIWKQLAISRWIKRVESRIKENIARNTKIYK